MAGFEYFVVKNMMGMFHSVPIVGDARSIRARRADTWDSHYGKAGRVCKTDLYVCPGSFLLSATTPDCIGAAPFFFQISFIKLAVRR